MKRILLVVILLLIISCDGYQSVCGLVVDSETKIPIEKVTIKTKGTNFTVYSDGKKIF